MPQEGLERPIVETAKRQKQNGDEKVERGMEGERCEPRLDPHVARSGVQSGDARRGNVDNHVML